MSFFQKFAMAWAAISQLVPLFLSAAATGRVQVRAIQITAGSTYRISGAADGTDDVVITVR